LYTFSFVVSLMPLLSQTLSHSRPKAKLAFAMHELTSSSMFADLESVLPKYVNLSTALRVSSLTVMAGVELQFSWY